jgi:hypothetical protein
VASVLTPAANLTLRTVVDANSRRQLFDAVVGSNGGLYGARFKRGKAALIAEAYVRMNVTRSGTVSGTYANGISLNRFSARFKLADSENPASAQVAEVSLGGGGDKLRLSISGSPGSQTASAQIVRAGDVIATVKLASLGVKNLTLAKSYTGTFENPVDGSQMGFTVTKVNLSKGTVAVSGMLPATGQRFAATSELYADPEGMSSASMSDFVVRVGSTARIFATWKLETESHAGDLSLATNVIADTLQYDLSGSSYAQAAIGQLLSPFVSSRDEAVVSDGGTELARFTAQGNRLYPSSSAFASSGGRFSLSYIASTGQVNGLITNSDGQLEAFSGVILQGDFRPNGALMGIGVTRSGRTIRFEPAN